MKAYAVLFQYSPNGRDDRGEFSAEVSENRLFASREEACSYVKSKYGELIAKERDSVAWQDEEWAMRVSDEDMKEIGYSWEEDWSVLSHEREPSFEGEKPEPKYSWRVVELSGETPEQARQNETRKGENEND